MTYTLRNPTTGAIFQRDVETEQEEFELLANITRFGWEIVEVD